MKNLVGTWRRHDVDETWLRRIDISTTSCACWEFAPLAPQYSKHWPPNSLNLPTPMYWCGGGGGGGGGGGLGGAGR